jgi:S-methyl-5-thioribose-1-phosphate isomerase
MVEPLRFEDGALLVLDQRLLPAEERWLRCDSPADVADCISTLAVRGAPALGIAAAYGMALADDPVAAAGLLRATRPTAVNLAWALEQVLAAPDPLARARQLHREQDEADRRLAALGAALFAPGDRALTHCNAGALATAGYGTAGGVLRAAWEQGRLEQVWVDETRPLLQGARLTTYELARAGIPYRLITDSSAGTLLARGLVERVVVGADRIAANGDVINKIGTYPLALAAHRAGVPFVVAAPESTVDLATESGAAVDIEVRESDELVRIGQTVTAPAGTPTLNLAFDVTPADLVTVIITEDRVIRPAAGERP